MHATSKRLTPFMALFACVGIALGAAAPVNADPHAFGDLSCSCHQPVPEQHFPDSQQIMQGIREGLSGLRAPQHQTERWFAGSSTTGFVNT